jgi:multidrug efflux pump subunit AcrA (membrane-fusion protein)
MNVGPLETGGDTQRPTAAPLRFGGRLDATCPLSIEARSTLSVAVAHRIVRVPSTAIVFDAKGVHVAGLDDDNRVHLIVVQPGRDSGSDVEIVDGLGGGERVLATPPADVLDGMLVQPIDG